jgi:hypothetical protein
MSMPFSREVVGKGMGMGMRSRECGGATHASDSRRLARETGLLQIDRSRVSRA